VRDEAEHKADSEAGEVGARRCRDAEGVTDLRLLHGTHEPLQELQPLRAGPVSLFLDGIDLRYLRIGGMELVRRVYTAVRDVDWDTVPGVVSNVDLEERDRGFRAEFDVRHARGEIDFAWRGTIAGEETGRIEFVFDGRAESGFPYNRIGICVHHPWRETAGARYRSRTPDGEQEGAFPDLVGQQAIVDGAYQALFPAYDRLEIELAGGGALLFEFEGDLWETEDHRNWTDANFKTYSTPISLGRPAPLEPGQPLRQRLVVTPVDVPESAAGDGPVRLSVGAPTGTRVPPIGLGHDRDAHLPDDRERELLAALAPAHLRAEVRLDGDGWRATLAAGQAAARAAGASLELALMFRDEDAAALAEVAAALAGGPPVARVLVSYAGGRTATPLETTPAHLVDLAREALAEAAPDALFVGGTEIYFTEINRTRPEHGTWDGICYSISPQIHAFTDIDVMENLDAQAETVRSARAIAGDKPVAVSPVTLRRRVNFHAAGDPPPTPAGELPDSVDVRQSALFGAAWTAGSVKYVSEAGAGSVTYYETTGWRGVVERTDGPELPERFASREGEAFPLYHPLADAIEWQGAEVLACESTDVLAVIGFAVRASDGTRLLVANLTPREREVVVAPLEGAVTLRRLNEATARDASADPRAFRTRTGNATAGGELALTLGPYEVVRVDS
jgi:D-apionolactonase